MVDRTNSKTLPTGVRIRENALEINFTSKKQRYYITLPHPPTAEGIRTAAKIRSDLINKAKWGILTENDIAQAKGLDVTETESMDGQQVLFQDVAQKFLKFSIANKDSKNGYRKILECHWMPYFALTPIANITTEDIEEVIIDRDFQTAKTFNNCATPLRGVFELAVKHNQISTNPMNKIKNRKVQVETPDPFTRKEMEALLDWLDKSLHDEDKFYRWYFEFAFWTGCRPSEMIALRESDIDWFNGTFKVSKSRVRGLEKKVTKTHTSREVYLNERSTQALKALLQFKKDQGYQTDYVMLCPKTKEPFFNEKPPRERLVEAMKACSIRHRPAYNARHTYATMLLMDGVIPMFVADQLGHSLQMLIKRYAKWLHGDKNKQEIAKLSVARTA